VYFWYLKKTKIDVQV